VTVPCVVVTLPAINGAFGSGVSEKNTPSASRTPSFPIETV
jgi:hypothetical protein